MTKDKPLFFSSIFLFSVFIITTFFVNLNFFNVLDLGVTIFLQEKISRELDTFFSAFSLVGSFEMSVIFILILWAIYKKLNYFSILLFFVFFHAVEFLGKYFLEHPNPPLELVRYEIDFSFPSSVVQTGSSYPSGHVGRTFFISAILFVIISRTKLTKPKKNLLYLALIVFGLIMFISRIYLGEHWFSDVIGGTLLGVSLGLLSLLNFKSIKLQGRSDSN